VFGSALRLLFAMTSTSREAMRTDYADAVRDASRRVAMRRYGATDPGIPNASTAHREPS
jgi:hypothetical protein